MRILLGIVAMGVLASIVGCWKPSARKGQLDFELPAAGGAKDQDSSNPCQVSVRIDEKAGEIRSIVVQSPQGKKELTDLPALEQYLKSIRGGLKNQNELKLEAVS